MQNKTIITAIKGLVNKLITAIIRLTKPEEKNTDYVAEEKDAEPDEEENTEPDVKKEDTICVLTNNAENAFVCFNSFARKDRDPEEHELLAFKKRYEEGLKLSNEGSERLDLKIMLKKSIWELFIEIWYPVNLFELEMIIKAAAKAERKLYADYYVGLSAYIQYEANKSVVIYRFIVEYNFINGTRIPCHDGDDLYLFGEDSEHFKEKTIEVLKEELEIMTGKKSERMCNNIYFGQPSEIIKEAVKNDFKFYNKSKISELIGK